MSLKALYRNILLQLQEVYNLSEATTITGYLFEKYAGSTRADIIRHPDQQLSASTHEQLQFALAELLEHKPIQYVLGETWFYHLKFKINGQALIPRPETEELVELLISNNRNSVPGQQILDIGTGSGCIAIAIKKNLPATIVTAIDISDGALELAKENAVQHNTGIRFLQMDFLNESCWPGLPQFDIIISNPPYIPQAEKEMLAKNVSCYEPHTALFVPGNDPLLFYEKIAGFSTSHLKKNGMIYLEVHEDHAQETASLFPKEQFQTSIKKDIFGKDRMIVIST